MFTRESIYYDLIEILEHIKITNGPLSVSATLKKRPDLLKFLVGFQSERLDSLSSDLKCLTDSD